MQIPDPDARWVFFFQEKYTCSKNRCFSKAKGGRKELFPFSRAILPPKEKLLNKTPMIIEVKESKLDKKGDEWKGEQEEGK